MALDYHKNAILHFLVAPAILALAALSQGIVWSSCSPDFGVEGVLERFGQIEPKVLFCADGYRYNGEEHDSLGRVAQIVEKLPTVRKVVVVPHLDPGVDVFDVPKAVRLDEWLRRYTPADIAFAQLPFNHPVFILFTSGTTGKPKCIVHGAGGSLLQALKMFKLHADVRPGDRYFYYCTTNWVVWNILFCGLAAEASVMLYDGSPFLKDLVTRAGDDPAARSARAQRRQGGAVEDRHRDAGLRVDEQDDRLHRREPPRRVCRRDADDLHAGELEPVAPRGHEEHRAALA